MPSSPDVFVSLDAASPGRLGELAVLLDHAGTSVVVDHHASNPGFGDVRLIDGGAPGHRDVLVADLLDELGVTLDRDLATLLYAGLAADTGSFRFGNTRPDTHELAARLLATGIDHSDDSRRLFDTAPFGWLGLLSVVTGRAVLEPEVGDGLVWTWSSTAEAAEYGLPGEQLEALVDVVRSTEEADVACVLKGQDDGSWSVSALARRTDLAGWPGARRRRPHPGRRLQLLPRPREDHRGAEPALDHCTSGPTATRSRPRSALATGPVRPRVGILGPPVSLAAGPGRPRGGAAVPAGRHRGRRPPRHGRRSAGSPSAAGCWPGPPRC